MITIRRSKNFSFEHYYVNDRGWGFGYVVRWNNEYIAITVRGVEVARSKDLGLAVNQLIDAHPRPPKPSYFRSNGRSRR